MIEAGDRRRESGNAPAGFVMLAPILLALTLALMALALSLYAQTVIADAAAEGARAGAVAQSAQAARERTAMLVEQTLGSRYAGGIDARIESGPAGATVVVEVSAPMPMLGLALPGPTVLEAHAHAMVE